MSPTEQPPPNTPCAECGATETLLTRVHVLGWNSEPTRDILLCPGCLTDHVVHRRSQGGRIEARLDDGRVVRW